MFLLKGIIIGIFVAFPVGPLGLMAIQRTLNKGWKTGFLSAVGAAASDVFYSSIAILGISFIDHFISRHKNLINGLTGILFLVVGINILISGIEKAKVKEDVDGGKLHPFFVHFLMGLSNPITFIVFFAIFTKIGLYVDGKQIAQHIIFIIMIFLGSSILWFIITNFIDRTKKNYKFESFILVDKIIGVFIIIFGIVNIIRGLFRI